MTAASEARRDAIVVLGCATGGGFTRTGRAAGAGELRGAAARRVATAAETYHRAAAPLVMASGGRRWGGIAEATAMADALERAGVPRAALRTELLSLSTVENARFVAARLLPDSRHIVLVTCDFHLRRATRAFEDAGFVVTPVAAITPPHGQLRATYLLGREMLSTALQVL